MINKIYWIISLSTCLMITTSCSKQNEFIRTHESDEGFSVGDSRNAWNELKDINGNSYVYESNISSLFGFGSITRITVINGQLTERSYQEYLLNDQLEITNTDINYSETEELIGSNEKGTPAHTIDELYNTCFSEYLIVDLDDNFIYFETDSIGLMNLCGFFPKNCADDCFEGIRISSFEFL